MEKKEILEKIRDLVCEQLSIERDSVKPETEIYKGLGADSLDLVEMLMNVESEWDIVVEDGEVGDLKVIGDVVDLVYKKIN